METPQFELIDPRPLAPERYLEIAKWHDCMHPVAASDPPLEEEWYRVNDLINALAEATSRATKAESRAEGLQAELAEQEREKLELVKDLAEVHSARDKVLEHNAACLSHNTKLLNQLAALKKSVAEDLGYLQDICGAVSDSDLMDEIGASADRLGIKLIFPASTPPAAPTPPPSSPAAAGPGRGSEFFLNGDPSINPFGPR